MWQLDRIALRAVGHPDARFAPLDVDLTNDDPRNDVEVGTPVDTVLWMENGTGKTTLLSLVLSVVRPRRNEFLSKDRDLADYVLGGDVAHVVLVLSRKMPGSLFDDREKLVVGQTLAWRNGRNSGRTEDLQRSHWGFRASAGFNADTLPVTREDGRASTLVQFTDELRRLMQANPQSEPFTPDSNQSRWESWLAARQLDTEIFRQQVGINADEGHISEAFNFSSGDQFVRWVLERTTTGDGLSMLATQVGELHDLLESREPLKREAELCVRLAAALDEMHGAHTLIEEAEDNLAAVYDEASMLAAQLDVAQRQASARSEKQAELAEEADAGSKAASNKQRVLQRQSVTARQRAAELRLEQTNEQQRDVAEQLVQATARRDAWHAVDDVLAKGELDSRHQTITAQLADLDDSLQPLRDRLSEVRGQFAARARHLLAQAEETATELQSNIEATDQERQDCLDRINEARTAATAARVAAATAGTKLEALDEHLQQAVSQGLIVEGQDLDIAAEEARNTLAQARADHEDVVRRRGEAKQAVVDARAAEQEARQEHTEAADEQRRASDLAEQMGAAAAAVAANQQVRSVADSDDLDPLAIGSVLLDRLRDAAQEARGAVVDAGVASAATRRLDETIERTSLAPARLDLEQAVTKLRESGIRAHTGWAYLADAVAPDQHRSLSTTRPDIADGLVVDTDQDRAAALALLVEQRPWAPIRVATKHEVDAAAAQVGDEHVIVAHAALHDRDVAADLRAEIAEDLADAHDTEGLLEQRVRELTDAAGAVGRLLQAYPDPAVVRDRLAGAEVALQRASEVLAQATEARQAVETEVEALAEAVLAAERDTARAEQRSDQVHRLRDDQQSRPAWAEQQADALREAGNLEDAARRDEERLRELGTQREQLLLQASDVANRSNGITDRCERLHITLADTLGEIPAGEVPLDVLERELADLSDKLRRERDYSGLQADLESVEAARAEVASKLQRLDDGVRELAQQLATTADAADAAQRRRSAEQAEQERDALRDQAGRLDERIDRLRSELDDLAGSESRPVDLEGLDAAGCDALAAQLTEQGSRESARASELARTAQQRSELAAGARNRAEEIGQATKNLRANGEVIRDVAAVDAWSGDDPHEAVRQIDVRLKRVTGELAGARELRAEQHTFVRGVVDDPTNRHFGEEDEAAAPIVVEMRRLSPAQLGAVAGRYRDEMHSRRDRIEEKLNDVDRHRAALAKMLLHETETALQTLRTVGLRSRMPDGLGEWSGRQFLTINHDTPPADDKAMADRMTRVIDDIVERGASPGANDLQFAGVRAAVGGDGFRVRIIKPHEELRHDPVDVTELNTFSGGQRLTAAVALFLTLMNMRNLAGGGSRGAAVLLLDNPFGKSSADTFVHVQRMLAERLGVQLVYTTAVKDLGALSQFRKTIRFAKKRHTGTGSLHVVEDPSASLRSVAMDRLRDSAVDEGAA